MRIRSLHAEEILFLRRRREGLTQVEAAEQRGESTKRYRAQENGESDVTGLRGRKSNKLSLAEKCVIARRRLRLTQSEVAKSLGYSTAHVCNMERGERNPAPLAGYFGIAA